MINLIIFLILTVSIAVLGYSLIQPAVNRLTPEDKRLKELAPDEAFRIMRKSKDEIEEYKNNKNKKRKKEKDKIEILLSKAGLTWNKAKYNKIRIISLLTTILFVYILSGQNIIFTIISGILSFIFIPNIYIKKRISKRTSLFIEQFPYAIDSIIRGIKVGQTVEQCMAQIAREGEEPLRSEFKYVVDQLALGITFQDAVATLSERIPCNETKFFSIAMDVSKESGANLSGTLENLSSILKARRDLRKKVQVLTQETKVSTMIIGAMPILIGGGVSFLNPELGSLLITTTNGNISLAVCFIMMFIGAMSMRKLINFKI